MVLDVKPIHMHYQSCTEDIIVTIAVWLGIDYQLMYAFAWNFEYKQWNQTLPYSIGQRLCEGEDKSWDYMNQYHGLDFKLEEIPFFDQASERMIQELDKKHPVILYLDYFYCDWRADGKKHHECTDVLVIGYERDRNVFICLDPYYTTNSVILSFETLQKGYKAIVTYSCRKQNKLPESMYDILGKAKNHMLQTNAFEQMRCLGRDIRDSLDFCMEQVCEEQDTRMPILDRIKYIIRRREQYAIFLRYIRSQCTFPEDEANDLMMITTAKWKLVLKLLMRSYYAKDWQEKRCLTAEKIFELSELEERLAKILDEVVKEKIIYGE